MSEVKSLFKVVNGMRYFGMGCKVTRDIYHFPETYWILRRVELSKDQDHGKVWGRLVWRGRPQPRDRRIHSARKHEWKLVDVPNYSKFKGKPTDVDDIISDANKWFEENGTWVNPKAEAAEKQNNST
mmetsp:Transcript_10003/g.15109  ORF Transcript_10003/g.15109 Transcript_10003/m.15109 type:complete len:127 (-) Transcript_10003:41-421(-)|eukprot:CAMPEP_0185024234 /NCGR_PEP_ID=MMETSP1103-20130426/7229_1 /TAXON_ID=36769 /ORGANISM="Paraphysomonas bandaiensis, Strain Caron Lab Isolate" /LENGTH=126 /DNA_ID=CAMNT_0027557153 /DNA_START=153 /DNA_END=533 /DNA_ORIENTATION=-